MSHVQSARRAPPQQSPSDFGPEIVDPTTGEVRYAIPIAVDDVAVGARAYVKRARRREAWESLKGITPGMHLAAMAYRQAWEHCQAGKGMGPMPWGADKTGFGMSAFLLPQERALSAAAIHTRGVQAMGLWASQSVVQWVVLDGGTVRTYEGRHGMRHGAGAAQLLAALERLAEAYGCE